MSKRLAMFALVPAALAAASCGDSREDATTGPTLPSTPPRHSLDRTALYVSGRVIDTRPGGFTLDYGPDLVTVEMDDRNGFPEGVTIDAGDRVTVSGLVDADLSSMKMIEAASVYIKELGITYFADAADEAAASAAPLDVLHPRNADLSGRVTRIDGRRFVLGSNSQAFVVDTAAMADDPLDDEGMPQIDVGDFVYAWGRLQLVPEAKLSAQGAILLSPARHSASTQTGA